MFRDGFAAIAVDADVGNFRESPFRDVGSRDTVDSAFFHSDFHPFAGAEGGMVGIGRGWEGVG